MSAINRNRLPAFLNRAIDVVADSPMSLLGRLAARAYGRPQPDAVLPTEFRPHALVRVLIAPVNYSGQGTAWARALERSDPQISARSLAIDVPGGFSFDADRVVPPATYHNDPAWQRGELAAAQSATHVLIEAEEPPFGRLMGRSVERQTQALDEAGVKVAFMAHGTDVRSPARDLAENPWSFYGDDQIYAPRLEALAQRNASLLRRSSRPVFVSTPDLLRDLPEALWCPVVVERERWERRARTRRLPGRALRVAHAPSVGVVKGTQLILPILEHLSREGLIELELIQGVASAEMPDVFGRADVVLDQFRLGSYGVAACEAMAAGCVVIGHVADRERSYVQQITGLALPILEATPASLEAVLRTLASADDLDAHIEAGRAYVAHVHDGQFSAAVLRHNWIDNTFAAEDQRTRP